LSGGRALYRNLGSAEGDNGPRHCGVPNATIEPGMGLVEPTAPMKKPAALALSSLSVGLRQGSSSLTHSVGLEKLSDGLEDLLGAWSNI